MEDKAKCSNLRGISGCFGATVGASKAMWVQYAHPRPRWGRKEQKTALHKDIFMGGSNVSTKRLTKQNAATLGASLVIWGPHWELLWPWACNTPIVHWDEVEKSKKLLYIRIFLRESCKQAPEGRQSKMQRPNGYLWLFWGHHGGLYGCGCAVCPSKTKMR